MKRTIANTMFSFVNTPHRFLMMGLRTLRYKITMLLRSTIKKKINGVLFDFDFYYDPAIKDMYLGTYEWDLVRLMKFFLKEGDTFIDVGANIGYLSAIAMGLVGKKGQVHSFEPVPKYFHRLKSMAAMNNSYNIKVNYCALGEVEGVGNIYITSLSNIGWNTMVPGLLLDGTVKEIVQVPVSRLDDYIKEDALSNIFFDKD